jgi:two-component system, NarL family, response regulator NreC
MAPKPYRIIVVDDHPVVRRGLRDLLNSQPDIEVCSEACNGVDAIERVKEEKPDLVLLDLTLPDMTGLDVARALIKESPSTDILVVTIHFSEELAREVIRAGALGYVLKTDADSELLAAVDHAKHHQPFFTSKLANTMAQEFARDAVDGSRVGGDPHNENPCSPLSEREIQVMQLLAEGKGNKQVAGDLGVSKRTIESHRSHIMEKMNFRNFSDLIRFAVRNGIVPS